MGSILLMITGILLIALIVFFFRGMGRFTEREEIIYRKAFLGKYPGKLFERDGNTFKDSVTGDQDKHGMQVFMGMVQ